MLKVIKYDWGYYYNYDHTGWISKMANSVGGVSIKYDVKNYDGTKDIKKYRIYFDAYNGADEIVSCKASGITQACVASADRLPVGKVERANLLENAWYNNSIRDVKINRIEVEYVDGTTESCEGNYRSDGTEQSSDVTVGGLIGGYIIIIIIIAAIFIAFNFQEIFP